MLDIKYIREHPDEVKQAALHKNLTVDIDELLRLDETRRQLQTQIESLQAKRNVFAHNQKGTPPSPNEITQGKKIKSELAALESQFDTIEQQYQQLLWAVPNVPSDDTPVGSSETDNVVAKQWGEQRQFDFPIKNHWELVQAHDWVDKARAAKVAGARFAYLKGGLVRLHFALLNFAMASLTDEATLKQIAAGAALQVSPKPFTLVLPPALARTAVYEATGRLDSEEQTYKLADDELWLNASAEHTLCPMYMDEILAEADLPLRYIGYTTAFRREAGSYGKDMEGIFRLHQFDKLEMESFTLPEHGLDEHLFLIAIQEYLMQQLELPYQVILKSTADIGKPNRRGVDIDTWMPGQDHYRETHTADYMGDYQARRLQTRVRREDGKVELVHTNDATVFSQRPLIAIIENYQQADGSVRVPRVLQPYYGDEIL